MDNGKWFFIIVENTYIGLGTKKTLRRFWVPAEYIEDPIGYYMHVIDFTGYVNGDNCYAEEELMFQQTEQDGTNKPLVPLFTMLAMASIGDNNKGM